MFVVTAFLTGSQLVQATASVCTVQAYQSNPWTTFMGNNQRSGNTDSAYDTSRYCSMSPYSLNATIYGQTTTASNGITYIGDEAGYLHAINLVTRKEIWKRFLGTTYVPGCMPPKAGVSSTPAITNGVIYVGGGDQYWYALRQSDGKILWSFTPGTTVKPNLITQTHVPEAITVTPAMKANVANNGYYNWSSPLIVGNAKEGFYAYIGVASFGDCPLVQGRLILMRLSDHKVLKVFKTVPDGTVGGGIWSSPSTDAPEGTPFRLIRNVYVTDGNNSLPQAKQPYAEKVLQLDASTLSVKSSFGIPQAKNPRLDSDWGSSPTYFIDKSKNRHIAAVNKSGVLYVLDANNLMNVQYSIRIGIQGSTISTCTSNAGLLYCAGNRTTIGHTVYIASLSKIDMTSKLHVLVWEKGFTEGQIVGGLASSKDHIILASGKSILLVDDMTGNVTSHYTSSSVILAAPSLANGTITVGNVTGQISILGQLV